MSDAATRFYQRSHEQNRPAVDPAAKAAVEASLNAGNHRYSTTYRYLREHPGLRVCEIGYGSTELLALLAPEAAEYHIVDIVDRSEGTDLPGNVRSTIANLDNDFPFEGERFDVIVAMMIVEHLYDPFHSFGEIARTLRKGGMAFVNLPNIANLRCRLQLLAGRMPVTSRPDWFEKREWDGNHLHYFTIDSTRRLGELNGLELVGVQPVGNRPKLKAMLPSLLCAEITFIFRKK